MNKAIDGLILLLIGVITGFNIFLSYIVAPLLFSNLDHRQAGEIMNIIFPYYFASGWIIGIVIYSLVGLKSIKDKHIIKNFKWFIIGILILILTHMALHKTVLPIARNINAQYYSAIDKGEKEKAAEIKSKFKTIHGISSVINVFNLILEIYLFQYYFLKVRRLKKE